MTTSARMRAFVTLADHGSVRGAAAHLVVTESTVSAAVRALAEEIGVPLLERDGRGVRLTPAGRRYADYARRVLGLLDEATAAARGEADPEHGHVRLAAVTTAGEHLLPDLLAAFRARHPAVELGVDVAPSTRVWAMLGHHEVDVVVAGRPPAGSPPGSGPPGRTPSPSSGRPRWPTASTRPPPRGCSARPGRGCGPRSRACSTSSGSCPTA